MDTTIEDISTPTLRLCWKPTCQKPLVRRKGEAQSSFEKRKHCDMSCSKTNPLIRQPQKEEFARQRESETKNCEVCGKEFCRGKNESRSVFVNRVTCSHLCSGAKRSRDFQMEIDKYPKICANVECKKTFYRRIRGESKVRFAKREACCQKCEAARRQANSKHPWKKKPRRPPAAPAPTLPPVGACPTDIPEAPKPTVVKVWRPESWGGSYLREVS